MKVFKKLLGLALVAFTLCAVALPAFAANVTVNPGQSQTITASASSNLTIRVTGPSGSTVNYTIQVLTDGAWKVLRSGTLTAGGSAFAISLPAGTQQILITFTAPASNTGPVVISY